MAQSRKRSLLEVCSNTSIGMVGSWIITYLTFLNVQDKALATSVGVILCTIWSLVRGYAVRRHFAATDAA